MADVSFYGLFEISASIGADGTLSANIPYFFIGECNTGIENRESFDITANLVPSVLADIPDYPFTYSITCRWNLYTFLKTLIPSDELIYYITDKYVITRKITDRLDKDYLPTSYFNVDFIRVYKIVKGKNQTTLQLLAEAYPFGFDRGHPTCPAHGCVTYTTPKLICGDRFIVVPIWYDLVDRGCALYSLKDKVILGRQVYASGNQIVTTGIGILDTVTDKPTHVSYILPEFDYYALLSTCVEYTKKYFDLAFPHFEFSFLPQEYPYESPEIKGYFPENLLHISLINENELHIFVASTLFYNFTNSTHILFEPKPSNYFNLQLDLSLFLSNNNDIVVGSFSSTLFLKSKFFLFYEQAKYTSEILYHYTYTFDGSQWALDSLKAYPSQLNVHVVFNNNPIILNYAFDTPVYKLFKYVTENGGTSKLMDIGKLPYVEFDFCYLWKPFFDSSKIIPKGKPIPFNMMTFDLSQIPSDYKFTHNGNTYIVYSRVSRKVFGINNEVSKANTVNVIYPEWITNGYPYEYTIAKIENNQIVSKLPEGFYILEESGFTRTIPRTFLPLVKISDFDSNSPAYKYGLGGRYFNFDLEAIPDSEIDSIWNTLYNHVYFGSFDIDRKYISLFQIFSDVYLMTGSSKFVVYRSGKLVEIFYDELLKHRFDTILYKYYAEGSETEFNFLYFIPICYEKDKLILLFPPNKFLHLDFSGEETTYKINCLPFPNAQHLNNFGFAFFPVFKQPKTISYLSQWEDDRFGYKYLILLKHYFQTNVAIYDFVNMLLLFFDNSAHPVEYFDNRYNYFTLFEDFTFSSLGFNNLIPFNTMGIMKILDKNKLIKSEDSYNLNISFYGGGFS